MPKLKNLDHWLLTHPKYTVDVTTLMLILASSTSALPSNSNVNRLKTNKEIAQFSTLNLSNTKSSSNTSNINTLKSSTKIRSSSPSTSTTATSTSLTTTLRSAEGSSSKVVSVTSSSSEMVNTTSSTKSNLVSNTAVAFSLENTLQTPVLNKNTGVLLPIDKWPLLANLATWLDKNPEFNVQQNHASFIKVFLALEQFYKTKFLSLLLGLFFNFFLLNFSFIFL